MKEIKNPAAKFVAEKLFDQIEFLEKEKEKYKEKKAGVVSFALPQQNVVSLRKIR